MDEDPKDHDFDQRKDGPDQEPTENDPSVNDKLQEAASEPTPTATSGRAQRPSVQIADMPTRRTVSNGANPLQQSTSAQSAPQMAPAQTPTAGAPPRHSTQIPRASTNMSRIHDRRTSRDFDRRTDGPFGRPSITMTRRRSSGGFNNVPMTPITPAGRRGTAATTGTATDGEERKEEGEEGRDLEEQIPSAAETAQLPYEPEPPSLNYTLRTRKMSIFIFWALILIDSIAMPIVLYFCLWYDTNLSPNAVFSIVTAALGGISIVEYVVRFRRLWKKGSTCRVIGARRSYLDWFHWNFSLAWVVIMVELIVGTIPTHPPIRLLSMPLASMLYAFGTELLIVDAMRLFHVPAPCRISSIPKGAQLRPGIYSIIEDVVAVDGSGGTEFREALNRRYEASHVFRAMLRRLGEFWAYGAEAAAILTTILVFTVDSKDAAYVIGWSLPFVWAGIWTGVTFWYVGKKLKEEKTAWAEEVAAKAEANAPSERSEVAVAEA